MMSRETPIPSSRRTTLLSTAAVFVGATLLAALMSPSVSLWTDEAVTISAANRTLGELWTLIQRIDSVHALYYAFMNVWVDVFGASPFSLRLPSALAAGGTAVGVYVLTRRLGTQSTALLAAGLSATLPRLVWSGIEARPFVFSALAAVWATFLLVRALQRPRAGTWVAYGAVAALDVATNIYLVMLVAAHAITVVILARRDRSALTGFVVSAVAVAVVAAPLLLLVRSQQAQLGGGGDRNPVSIARKVLVNQLFLGETPDPDVGPLWFTRAWQAAAILAAVLGIAAIVVAVVRRPAAGDDRRGLLAMALPWIILPTALVAVYAIAVAPIYQPRYFTFTAPAAAILMALGLRAAGRRWFTVLGVVVYIACISVVYASQRTPFAKSGSDWSAVADVVADLGTEGDGVYFAPRYADRDVIDQTTRRIAQAYPEDFLGLDDLTLRQTGAETGRLDGFSVPLAGVTDRIESAETVWGVFSQKSPPSVLSESEAVFERLGYAARVVWEGPSTLVVEYVKSD